MNKSFCFLIFFIIILGINFGCQKNTMNKKTLKINYVVTPESFHPHRVCDVRTETLCKALYEGLTRVNPKDEIELVLAEKVEISPCKKRYTFTLKDSTWSNGQRITSQHFVDAWKRALDPKRSKCAHVERFFIIRNAKKVYKGELPMEDLGVYAPNDQTIVVELEHPAPFFLQQLADPVYSPIFNPLLDEIPTVFNGPFVLEKYDFNRKIVLSSNSFYWDAKSVKLKGIEMVFIKDAQAYLDMYEKGDLDYVGSPFTDIPDDMIKGFFDIKFKQASAPFWVYCNTKNPKLSSSKIRKALSLAIDRQEILKHVISHQKESLHSILPKDLSFNQIFEESDINILELFEEGLKESNLDKNNFQLTLDHCYSSEQRKIATYLKYQWEKIFGIRINLLKKDWNSFYASLVSGDYELGGCFVCNIYDDPSYLMELFESSSANLSKWENQKYKQLLNLANQTADKSERNKYLKEAEELLIYEMPVIPIYNHGYVYLITDTLKGFVAPKFSYADFKWAYFD